MPVAESVRAALHEAGGVALVRGLWLGAGASGLVFVMPFLMLGVAVMSRSGADFSTLFSVLLLVEHGVWWVAVASLANVARGPGGARPCGRIGVAAAIAGMAGALGWVVFSFVYSHDLVQDMRGWSVVVWGLLGAVGWMVLSRGVGLLAAERTARAGLAALGLREAARVLRVTAALGALACAVAGLGTFGILGVMATEDFLYVDWHDAWYVGLMVGGGVMLGFVGAWLMGLAGAVVCAVTSKKVERRLKAPDQVI